MHCHHRASRAHPDARATWLAPPVSTLALLAPPVVSRAAVVAPRVKPARRARAPRPALARARRARAGPTSRRTSRRVRRALPGRPARQTTLLTRVLALTVCLGATRALARRSAACAVPAPPRALRHARTRAWRARLATSHPRRVAPACSAVRGVSPMLSRRRASRATRAPRAQRSVQRMPPRAWIARRAATRPLRRASARRAPLVVRRRHIRRRARLVRQAFTSPPTSRVATRALPARRTATRMRRA